jgi:hypothetical protein
LTGFHKRDAGGRAGPLLYSERKLRLKMRPVRLQRAGSGGSGSSSGAGERGVDDDGPAAGGDAVVGVIVVVMLCAVDVLLLRGWFP